MTTSNPPRAERPGIRDYGVPETTDGLLDWAWVETHLRDSFTYWISTVRPDGRPHAVPTWAAWLDGALWLEGGAATRRARNLEANPNAVVTIHVDDDAAVIVEGVVERRSDPDPGLAARLVEAYGKYRDSRWSYEADPANWSTERGGGLWVLTPTVVLAWTRFPDDATRFRWD